MKRFYDYVLTYPDGSVFYVGKGTGDRIHHHEKEARGERPITNPYKVRVIRKIWAGGGEVGKEIVYETDDEEAAFEMERELISFYGRSNLTNLTDGGEGMSKEDAARHALWMRENSTNAKVWPGFIDPFGTEYKNIKNLYAFCEDYDLTYNLMLEVAKGKRDHYKGWRRLGQKCWTETEFVEGERFDAYALARGIPGALY